MRNIRLFIKGKNLDMLKAFSDESYLYNYIVNNSNSPCIILANKADKIAVTKVDAQVANLQNQLNPLKDLDFLPYSSERKIYSDNVWENIEKYL